MKKAVALAVAFLTVLSLAVIYVSANIGEMMYDNTSPADELISFSYSQKDFEEWRLRASNFGKVATFWDFLSRFRVECLRKTFEGYYAVLELDNGTRAFIFFNSNLEVASANGVSYCDLVCDQFFSKAELETAMSELTENNVLSLNKLRNRIGDPLGMPFSSAKECAYIVQEGIMIIYCEDVNPTKINGVYEWDTVVTATEFLSNEEWRSCVETWNASSKEGSLKWPPLPYYFPYILEIDKASG